MVFFVTWDRLYREPNTLPRGNTIVILHAGPDSDRPRLLEYMKYNHRFEGLSLSVVYIADTLDEAEAKVREDGWGPHIGPREIK